MFLSVVRASLARPCMFEIPRWGTFDRASYVVLGLRSAKGGCRRAWRAILTLRERTNVPDVYPFFRNPICSRPATNGLSVPARSLVKPECPSTRAPLQGRGVPPSFLSAARRHQPREASHVRDFDVPRWGTFDRTPYTFLAYRWRRSCRRAAVPRPAVPPCAFACHSTTKVGSIEHRGTPFLPLPP